ncbi:TonB-dependent receptor [Prevotella sp. 10(H)]|uniref:TonB-dependent receptor n=1 Tax=Prevotella sp. 10(H) TaxID=1158294 RepID=UPI0004A73FFB|nr:TonB-dependent receptor [Prevotella sp. 10(H)]
MRKLIFFLALFLITNCFYAQVKTIKGQLKKDGMELMNLSFKVKDRGIKGKTDRHGYFILKNVTDDDIIVTGDWGTFTVKEVTISVLSETPLPKVSALLESSVDTIGVAYLRDNLGATYYKGNLSHIESIKKPFLRYHIEPTKTRYYYSGYKISYTGHLNISTVGRLPKRQSEYAQGNGDQWLGPDKKEIFSWGPSISSLEFDGKPYDYDRHGSLVPRGMGNGIAAKAYDPTDFFRTGISFGNNVNIKMPGFSRGFTSLSLGQKRSNNPIPNAYDDSYNVSLMMDDMRMGRFKTGVGAIYNNSYSKLPQHGANLASLMYSVFTTPPTFDNANGMSRKDALKNEGSWKINDDTQRSYSTGINNPFLTVSTTSDRDKTQNLMAYAKTNYSYEKITADAYFSFDKQWDKRHQGDHNLVRFRSQYRSETSSNIAAAGEFSYKIERIDDRYSDLYLMAKYGFKHSTDKLHRNRVEKIEIGSEASYFEENIYYNPLLRNAHDVKYGAKLGNGDYTFELHNKHYFSNTAKSSDYVNLFPEAGFSWNMNNFLYDAFDTDISNFTVYGSVGRSIGEASLVYRNPAALSTYLNSGEFNNYYEYPDIIAKENLKPETYLKSEAGIRYYSPRGSFTGEINGFIYNTHNFISPVASMYNSRVFDLHNIGRIRNYGYFVSLTYTRPTWSSNALRFDAMLTFSQVRNKVTALYGEQPFIRLAGFQDVATVFAKDEPLGAIYGTTFQRNDKGQLIIGDDGFPLKDFDIKKIGDPTPDFTMSLIPSFEWKKFNLSFTIEYSQGGDRWNGTKATMDYQGVSEDTAEKRNIKGYVFQGVDAAGITNTKVVDFYDTANPGKNRWVRYGTTGVGEDYIEDATYVRLTNVSLSYAIFNNNRSKSNLFKSMRVGVTANNLVLITSYKGVDPASSLFGYSAGKGLDLFNLPSNRSYSFTLTFEL